MIPGFREIRWELARERMAARLHARRERRLVERFGGRGALGPTRPPDYGAALRTMAALGLRPGEYCGCHRRGCDACLVTGGCGDWACMACQPLLLRLARTQGGAKKLRRRRADIEYSPGSFPGAIDVHVHHSCASVDDSETFIAEVAAGTEDSSATTTKARVDRIVGMFGEDYARSVFLMGAFDGELEDSTDAPVRRSIDINRVTEAIWDSQPLGTYSILPFYHVRPEQFDDAATLDDLTERIEDDGWYGVGELVVHGHGYHHPDPELAVEDAFSEVFLEMLVVAATEGVPVAFHWEFGLTDDILRYTPERAFEELTWLLDEVGSRAGRPLKTVICHCGVGPRDKRDPADPKDIWEDASLFEAWQERIQTLLDYFPFVWFDIAGLQLTSSNRAHEDLERLYDPATDTVTLLGEFLLDRMASNPKRFLIGTDADDALDEDEVDRWGIESFLDSYAAYEYFLGLGTLTDIEIEMIWARNAWDLLYRPEPAV